MGYFNMFHGIIYAWQYCILVLTLTHSKPLIIEKDIKMTWMNHYAIGRCQVNGVKICKNYSYHLYSYDDKIKVSKQGRTSLLRIWIKISNIEM